MEVVFITNMYNHHTGPLGDAFYKLLGKDYYHICTEPVDDERLSLGWIENDVENTKYLYFSYTSPDEEMRLRKIADRADVVIYGGMDRSWISGRIQRGLLTFRYSERLFKKGFWRIIHPKYLKDVYMNHWTLNSPNFHLLCASTYCALDMSRLRVYNGRMWKWGYFTRAPEKPTAKREKTSAVEILWCGRMLKWKQVDHLLKAAVKLKKEGLAFHINIVGEGAEESSLKKFSLKHGLDTHVTFHGSVSPTEVLHYMAASHIYVLPSNYQEGWGAVVNEAMSSGCCVVSSSGVGSAGFLISSGENGFIYRNGNISELSTILSKLIRNPEIISDTGTAALETMKLWTPEIAARRFMELVSSISSGAAGKNLFAEGPCSRAEVIKHLNEKRE